MKHAELAGHEAVGGTLKIGDEPVSVPNIKTTEDKAYVWKDKVSGLLEEALGPSEGTIFRSDATLPAFGPLPFDRDKAPREAQLYVYLQRRLYRLERSLEKGENL